jgi:hypothetical protein
MGHKISMRQPKDSVINRDVEFLVYRDGKKLGTLKISRGSLDWIPSNGTVTRYLSWSDFALIMESRDEVIVS